MSRRQLWAAWRSLNSKGLCRGIGIGGSLGLARWLRSLLFEVAPGDPLTLGAVAVLLAGTGLPAGYAPARRATRVDPMPALRRE